MKIAFVRANNYEYEPRLINQKNVAEQVAKAILILWNRDEKYISIEEGIRRLNMAAPFGKRMILLLPFWFCYVVYSLIVTKPDIIQACNFESVIPTWFYTRFFRRPYIYDIWDTATGMYGGDNRFILRTLNRMSRFFIRKSSYVFVPDLSRFQQIGVQLEEELPEKHLVVYNSFSIENTVYREFNFSGQPQITLAYVGVLSRNIRGLEWLIEAVGEDSAFQLDIAGYGSEAEYFEDFFKVHSHHNIHYHGKVEYAQSRQINQSADILISLLDPHFVNYKYATSTKVFEAIALGKPVITSKGTASGKLVEDIGWGVTTEFTKSGIKEVLGKIKRGEVRFNLDSKKAEMYDWNQVSGQVKEVYLSLGAK